MALSCRAARALVLDLSGPARIEKSFVLDAADGQPARLVLDLAAVDRPTFLRTLAVEDRAPLRRPRSRTAILSRAATRARSS